MTEQFCRRMANATFWQLTYFIKLLFPALRDFMVNFGVSPEILNDHLNQTPDGLKGIGNDISRCLVDTIVEITCCFLRRNFKPRDFGLEEGPSDTAISEILRDTRMMVQANQDRFSYTFMWRDPDAVPDPIKLLILMQDHTLFPRLNGSNLRTLFQ